MMLKTTSFLSALVLGMLTGHAQKLTDDDFATLELRTLEKLDDFISFLPERAAKKNKSKDEQQLAQKYISKALEMFIGEGEDYECEDQAGTKRIHEAVKIQTTSRGRANRPQLMKHYLNRLTALPYQEIHIDSAEVYIPERVSNLGNGLYACIFNVLLVNFSNNKDRTSYYEKNLKKCKLYVKPVRYAIGPNEEEQILWHTKLGNIYVTNKYK